MRRKNRGRNQVVTEDDLTSLIISSLHDDADLYTESDAR